MRADDFKPRQTWAYRTSRKVDEASQRLGRGKAQERSELPERLGRVRQVVGDAG